MCLILLAYRQHPQYPLIVVANRDEFHQRETAAAAFWGDAPHILAGRDLRAGGTWLGITRSGRLAAVTNYREGAAATPGARSRGELTADFLRADIDTTSYLADLQQRCGEYAGFNLLLGDVDALYLHSNRDHASTGGQPQALTGGLLGISNGAIDTRWPKVAEGLSALEKALDRPSVDALFAVMADRQSAADHLLPDTGVGIERERLLSSRFICTPGYGTRASTVLLFDTQGNVSYSERSFNPEGICTGQRDFSFDSERAKDGAG